MAVHLILGGARSGKSRFAEQTALAQPDPVHYIATAEPADSEMTERIQHHRANRSERFTTHECPHDLAEAVQRLDHKAHTLVVDCLTLWLSNWIEAEHDAWLDQRQNLLNALTRAEATVVLVSNEVGLGVVPMGAISRRFVDEAGRLHQDIAHLADRVTFVVAGLPQELKSTRDR